jgi:malonate-semialdehyde dehydrogenase (acetylating) / methylmalonate-semialdehyde dehydrogenase
VTETAHAPTLAQPIPHWIAGAAVDGTSSATGPVYNPSSGEQTGTVGFASPTDVDAAVQVAKAAFPAWRALSLGKRAELMFKIRQVSTITGTTLPG